MKLNVGQTLFSQRGDTAVIVVRAPSSEVLLLCGNLEMVTTPAVEASNAESSAAGGSSTGTLLGKRYVNATGDLELLCTKAGPGPLIADGEVLAMKQARPLPASD